MSTDSTRCLWTDKAWAMSWQSLGNVLEIEQPDRVVIEVGSSAGWIGDVIRRAGIELQVANPNHEGMAVAVAERQAQNRPS